MAIFNVLINYSSESDTILKKPINILMPAPKNPAPRKIYAIVVAVSKWSNTDAKIIDSSERRMPQKLVVNIYKPDKQYDKRKVTLKIFLALDKQCAFYFDL